MPCIDECKPVHKEWASDTPCRCPRMRAHPPATHAARPKWIPTYRENKFEDGREHIAKWSGLFEAGDEPVNKEQFCERLAALKFDMPLGPPGFLTAKQADVSEAAASAFWEYMSRGKPTLSPKQMKIRLNKMLADPTGAEGVMWSDFIDCLTADNELAEDLEEAIVVVA
jgi:hypothetical protein